MEMLKSLGGETKKPERIKYVEVLPTTGWQTMVKTVRDFDEDKIRDTKEDIDTLLVFAGLFSAVLSAFLVETYQLLQPPEQDQIVFLLQQLVVQNFTFVGGSLNSTSSLQTQPAFEPPAWASRLNGLWFASLILSLAAASFSMLVKSWLREYLAVEGIAPQLRLRARQYRYPALGKWKLFEIAAALPLLLQLALGLFFIGLCIFTAEIDAQMRLVSLPLVAAWAFLFFMSTIAPLISPRCPFKLPLLKSTLRWGRKSIMPYVLRAVTDVVWLVVYWIPGQAHRFRGYLLFTLDPSTVCRSPVVIPDREKLARTITMTDEEEVVIYSAQDDTEILLSTDEMMLDDSLLDVMYDALRQSRPDPSSALQFVLSAIRNRVAVSNEDIPSSDLSTILDLAGLSKRAYDALMKIVADQLSSANLGTITRDSPSWVKDAVLILMSSSPYPTPPSACRSIGNCIMDDPIQSPAGKALGQWLKPSTKNDRLFPAITNTLLQVFYSTSKRDMYPILQMFNTLLGDEVTVEDTLLKTAYKVPKLAELPPASSAKKVLEALFPLLTYFVREDATSSSPHLGSEECVRLILHLGQALHRERDAADVFKELWRSWRTAYRVTIYIAALNVQCRLPQAVIDTITEEAMELAQPEDRVDMLKWARKTAKEYVEGKYDEKSRRTPIDYVQFCFVYMQLYRKWIQTQSTRKVQYTELESSQQLQHQKNTTTRDLEAEDWTGLWNAIYPAVRRYKKKLGWSKTRDSYNCLNQTVTSLSPEDILSRDRTLAETCLEWIEALDSPGTSKSSSTPRSSHVFPDELVAALGSFISPDEASKFPRLQPLMSMLEEEEGEEEKKSASDDTKAPATTSDATSAKETKTPRTEKGQEAASKPSRKKSDSAGKSDDEDSGLPSSLAELLSSMESLTSAGGSGSSKPDDDDDDLSPGLHTLARILAMNAALRHLGME